MATWEFSKLAPRVEQAEQNLTYLVLRPGSGVENVIVPLTNGSKAAT
jgi:hypothetical protein